MIAALLRRSMAALVGLILASAIVSPAFAADGLTMEASSLMAGHVRTGQWMAVDVHLTNDGPPVVGELHLEGGAGSRTRFSVPVDLPTQSDKVYRMYVQPPAFGRDVMISLADGATTIASTKVPFKVDDPTQLVVGIVAEQPGDLVGNLGLLPNQNNLAPVVLPLSPEDLPERVEAWATLDRLVWQDTDASRLSAAQVAAMRGWIAGGGRLVIVGGTAGPSILSSFPDELLPYRPTTTTDIDPATLSSLLGDVPPDSGIIPALSGELTRGSALAVSGDRVIAAESAFGTGNVTVIGFDPTADWIADTDLDQGLWRRLLPTRAGGGAIVGDDSQIVSAATQLPSLALPPVSGLILLLGAYILLIGPINYIVLRRLDRRELAWVTMPVLIVVFAVGAYGFGAALRGSELIINEVAIVRGAPGASDGTAQVYLGVFSPSRGTYQLRVPGGALLSSPINGDFFGGDGSTASLDVVQGDPARVRDLAVGFGSLRTVRAESAVTVPVVEADVRLKDGRLTGTVRNTSSVPLLKPAVVLGGTVASLADLGPGEEASFDVALADRQIGQQLSDKVVGPVFFGDPRQAGEDASRLYARHTIVDQLTFDPNFGFTGQLPADGPVVLAWSDRELLPVEIDGQQPRRTGNVLYFLPTDLEITGTTTFRSDLITATVVSADAGFFSKDPYNINMGRGTAEVAYRPIAFDGRLDATELALGFNFGDPNFTVNSKPIEPLVEVPPACGAQPEPEGCGNAGFDGLPEVELYDLEQATWRRLPHMDGGSRYAVAGPDRFVDPATGTVRIRFVNDRSDGVGFNLDVGIEGAMR
jgi:hypothetical protein